MGADSAPHLQFPTRAYLFGRSDQIATRTWKDALKDLPATGPLAVEHPSGLFGRQPCGQLAEQRQKAVLILS